LFNGSWASRGIFEVLLQNLTGERGRRGGRENPGSNKPFQVDVLIVLPGNELLGHVTGWLAN